MTGLPMERTGTFVTCVFVPTTGGARADGPIALALCRADDDGSRWRLLVDGDYARGLKDLPNVDGDPFALHSSRVVLTPRTGWPQDWAPDAPPDLIDLADEVDRFGWQAVHARLTANGASGWLGAADRD
jgi:hypothetical protein